MNEQLHLTMRLIILRMNGQIDDDLWAVILTFETRVEINSQSIFLEGYEEELNMMALISGTYLSNQEVNAMACRVSNLTSCLWIL